MFHPNVFSDGKICLDVIKGEAYSAASSMEARIDNIVLLLQDANVYSPANSTAAELWGKSGFRDAVLKYMNSLV